MNNIRVRKQYRYYSNYYGIMHTFSRRRAVADHVPTDGDPDPIEVWAVLEDGRDTVDCYSEEQARLVCELLRTYRVAEQRAAQAVAEANAEAS